MSELIDALAHPDMPQSAVRSTYSEIASRYDEKWRHYHGVRHMMEVTNHLLEHKDQLNNPRVTLWSAIGHDAIYLPKLHGGLNEEYSAEYTQGLLEDYLPADEVELVGKYIRRTKYHLPSLDIDASLLNDADLKILASAPDVYNQYETNIRKEYEHVAQPEYVIGRKAVLESFLKRPYIYSTQEGRKQFENVARHNLRTAIAELQ